MYLPESGQLYRYMICLMVPYYHMSADYFLLIKHQGKRTSCILSLLGKDTIICTLHVELTVILSAAAKRRVPKGMYSNLGTTGILRPQALKI
jgi:hypothetical protein